MAQAAAKNSTLLAHLIEDRCQQQNITWAQLAAELQISETQLAKLALCRQPGNRNFKADVAQAARHAKMDTQKLTRFLQPDSAHNNSQRSFWQTVLSWPNKSGDQSMVIKRAAAFGVVLLAIFFMSAFIFSQPNGPTATLQVTSGEVTVRQTASFNRATTVIVSAGESLAVSGSDTIEVSANAAAELYLFEGSVVELAENTMLELTELAENSSEHQIYLTLFNGRILNRVTKLLGINDAYEVRTPSSTASVRGTIFSVEVFDENTTQVIVSEGIVEVSLGNESAEVGAGEMVTAVTGQPLNIEPASSSPIIPATTPNQAPDEPSTGQSDTQSGSTTLDEAAATHTPSGTPAAENPESTGTPTTTTESPALPTHTAGTVRPTNTPANSSPPASPASPANSTAAPATPTNAAGATRPPNAQATALPPTNTPLPNVPTKTAVPNVPTNTPLPPAATNTPVPVVPTNTPVPVVPTNTPIPPSPTDTPPPPLPTEEPSKVTICHNPGPNQQTMQVNSSAVQGHLNHGDYLGPCN